MDSEHKFAALTTKDNPFSPFTQFDEWKSFDDLMGYGTCAYLARIAQTSNEFPDELNDIEIEKAIDEIVEMNLTGNYKKVFEDDYDLKSNEKDLVSNNVN